MEMDVTIEKYWPKWYMTFLSGAMAKAFPGVLQRSANNDGRKRILD